MSSLHISTAAAAIFQAAFAGPRDPRSEAYKNGVRAALAFRIDGKRIPHPYDPATAE